MADKRRHKRYTLDVMEVNGKMVFATEVKIIDISIGGIALKADRRLNIGGEYALKLGDKSKVISLRGVVVWSTLSETRKGPGGEMIPIYAAGMKFTNITAELINELLYFVEHNKKEEVHIMRGPRLNIRFHLKTPGKGLLSFPDNYKVNQISLGGMLIECVLDLDIESKIPMELSFPGEGPIRFIGRVASRREITDQGRNLYAIGMEFVDLRDEDRKVLSKFIDYLETMEVRDKKDKETIGATNEQSLDISKEFKERIEYLNKWHKSMGYYKMLGVREYATSDQIRAAYYRMAREFHPDKYPGVPQDFKDKLNVLFNYLSTGYSTLMDPEKRKEYDKTPISRIRH